MGLAKRMLDADKQHLVIQYLERCGRFWGGSDILRRTGSTVPALAEWIEVIRADGTPDFRLGLAR
jgi:hypothetical protein